MSHAKRQPARPAAADSCTLNELVIVDSGVEDAAVLLDGMRRGAEVLHLTLGGRGLERIAEQLADRRNITGLHVLCHGEPGALLLAGERVDLPALAMRRAVLLDIAAALAEDATVVLYGCSVLEGSAGRRFVGYLEALLGVPVAAAQGPVRAATLGC